MFRDNQKKWFCPDCILEKIDPAFLDEAGDDRGDLTRPYLLSPLTRPVSLRLPVADVEQAKQLARKKGIPKYQSYIKTLLHEALVQEANKTGRRG